MQKPLPLKEIHAEFLPHSQVGTIEIWVASENARSWVLANVGEFGDLNENRQTNHYSLIPSPLYDRHEVLRWIGAMGETQEELTLETAKDEEVPESER